MRGAAFLFPLQTCSVPSAFSASGKFTTQSSFAAAMLQISPTSPSLWTDKLVLTVFIGGVLLLGSYHVMAVLSQGPNGEAPIPIPVAILLMEFLKFAVSFFRYAAEVGRVSDVFVELKNVGFRQIIPYSIPGFIYMFNNNLEIIILKFVDPTSLRLLTNGRIITTSLFFRYIMDKEIGNVQIGALLVLFFGCLLGSSPSGDAGATKMYVTGLGLVLICLYVTNSGLATVVNEWLMKKAYGCEKSIHLQNMILYLWGIVFNVWAVALSSPHVSGFRSNTQFFWWISFVLNGSFHGLAISFIMKHLSSIHKLFMGASSIYVSGALNLLALGANTLPLSFFVSASLVICAVLLYEKPEFFDKWRAKAKSVEDAEENTADTEVSAGTVV